MWVAHERLPRDGFEDFIAKDLFRFTTAGSVDDGKSTLIGRLLHDSKAVYEDQFAAVKKSRINRSGNAIDFALLTDGLRAEREQGITIDVAYRYFSTSRRTFIIADTPGHEQYTRNMATGASTADLAIILVDATKGLLPQTRRHTYIAALLGIPNFVAAINKMDLVGYRAAVFFDLERQFSELAQLLRIQGVRSIPISALEGDNVVSLSGNMPWYSGPSLIDHLETVEIRRHNPSEPVRFPIQCVIRPDASFRGFAGRVSSGVIRRGQALLALPSRQRTSAEAIVTYDGRLELAIPSQSVTLKLADEIDLSRGDMLVSVDSPPHVSNRFVATLVWLHEDSLIVGRTYLLKHTGQQVNAKITQLRYRVNVNEVTQEPAETLEMNGIGSIEIETSRPLFVDPYTRNRTTGSFILIDSLTNSTVGAGMIADDIFAAGSNHSPGEPAPNQPFESAIALEERRVRHGHSPAVIFICGNEALSGLIERTLFDGGFEVIRVGGDAFDPSSASDVLSALWSAGFVILYSNSNFSADTRRLCETIAGGSFLHLSARDSEESALRRVLEFADALCARSELELN